MKIDLHIHTHSSDGLKSKEEIIKEACALGLDIIAITDHNILNTDYLTDKRIRVIPGIELSCAAPVGVYHILGLFFNEKCDLKHISEVAAKNQRAYAEYQIEVDKKFMRIYADKYSYDISDYDSFQENRTPLIGEQYVYRARQYLISKGLCKNIDYFWNRIWPEIFPDGPGCGSPKIVSAEEGIAAVKRSGGIAIMAHPTERLVDYGVNLADTIKHGTELGVDGYECIHYSASEEKRKILLDWCRQHDLYITCGSDYHGGKGNIKFGYSDEEYAYTYLPFLYE